MCRPRLAVLDIYLPDLNGVQVLKEVRRYNVPTDFVMITAAHDVETVQEMLRFGAVDYIVKPFKFERLRTALDKYKRYARALSGRTLNQEVLDRLMNMSLANPTDLDRAEELPKGLREITLSQILAFFGTGEKGYSAEDVAKVSV